MSTFELAQLSLRFSAPRDRLDAAIVAGNPVLRCHRICNRKGNLHARDPYRGARFLRHRRIT